MVSFEYLFGNYEEAVKLWTAVANELWDVFNGGAEARNEMLRTWHEGIDGVSGYQLALESLSNFWQGFVGILNAVKDAIADVFPPMTAERLLAITESVHAFSEGFRDAFTYVQDVEDAVEAVIKPFAAAADEAVEVSENVAQAAYDVDELAQRVLNAEFGNGDERRSQLEALGYSYEKIQNRVNELLGSDVRLEETEESVAEAGSSKQPVRSLPPLTVPRPRWTELRLTHPRFSIL